MPKTYHTYTVQFKVSAADWHIAHGGNESKVVGFMAFGGWAITR